MIYDPDKNTALPLTLGVAVYKIDGVQLFFSVEAAKNLPRVQL